MLRAGVTDAVHSDVGGGGDGADGPHPWIFEGDNDTEDPLSFGGCDAAADDGDNFSIDLDALYNLLDSEQPVSSSIQEDALQANQSEGNTHFEKASSPQDEALLGLPLEVEEHGHSKCTSSHDLDTSSFKEGNDLVSSYEASKCPKSLDLCNQSSEFVKPPDSHLIDISSSMSHASDWLSLSTLGYKNSLVDSAGCSVPMVSGFEYQQLQTQSPETLASEISVYKSIHGSQHAEPSNNIHLGFKKGRESVERDGDSLDGAAMSCKDKTFISSSNHFQQGQAADSSHFISMGTYNFGNVHNDVCINAMLNTGRQEEKTCSTAVDSSNDLGANPPNMLNVELNDLDSYSPNVHNAELNNGWATEMTWNAWSYLPVTMNSFPEVYGEDSAENISMQFLPGQLSQSFISCDRQHMIDGKVKEEGQGHVSSGGCTGNEVKPYLPPDDTSFLDSDSSLSEISCNGTNYVENIHPQCASYPYSFQVCSSTSYTNENNRHLADSSESLLADSQLFVQNKKQKIYSENVEKDKFLMVSQKQFHLAKSVTQVPSKDLYGDSTNVDEDPDICIIDDTSNANDPPCPVVPKKSYVVPPYYPRTSSSRCQADDEKLTFQIALQDLAQPKAEANPPEGVLAVPLLRHQRIALSWMVQKETHNLQCSGGILADDQGLGKTVSTIALILMERSPSSKSCAVPAKGEFEALNLDEDEEFPNSNGLNQENSNMQVTEGPLKSENTPVRQKGRPATGTLVVCPTSVLRQWADELRNKVTSEANLSFLVYHGSNRTRDPYELVKYDVVLTTYSIVSMEVPMRSTVDKSDGKGRPDTMGTSFDCSAGKKRKDSPRNLKDPDRVDSSLLESTARPLARVGWFRVILDEAQTIKNHRTQVARACWGLRAKRRWCLSGTPIQNAVDDLYSYFRFLKYEPFSVYNSFCSKIKIPINRDPAVGYRKLQAVLRTIMLRRTKGTLIDGKPIINLPPKTIMLKKVDFSVEERAFYSRLEAESREKFKGYADAGTVKQNYVNILLMLLRLRQACDHPLLVKGCDSSSVWRTSIEAAKKIPRDKQIELLNSLETCLALCTICNDPPEDAVVAVCGHVYCNQCISEHLTGDDNFCPSANCKVKLTGASVFSKATLKSCLSGLPLHDCPEASEVTELLEANTPSHSSKIKAAVELLQSLPTYNDSGSNSSYCLADDKCTVSTKIACSTVSGVYSNDKKDKECLNSAKCSNASVSEKAIVYSQWTRMLDLLEVRLKSLCIQYRRLDGTMTVASRDKAVKDFNTLPEVTVMIMSLKAASLGLNMVSACHVLLLDLWWNPTTEDQAIDRAHRIGQTRPVTVSRLTVENTVEDRILALQEKKREMVASAFGEDESGRSQTRLTVEDLRYLFRV